MHGPDIHLEVSCVGAEAHYISKNASKKEGSNIGSGDEGGPVLKTKLNEDLSKHTTDVTLVVGHEFGK